MVFRYLSFFGFHQEDSHSGTPAGRTDTTVIPTETPIIAPTIPPSLDYTLASPDYSPASDSESDPSEDPSSDHIPPLPAISPFLSSTDDTTDSDTPDTPPSPTHGTPFTEITSSTQRSLVIPLHMMTARKRVGPLPVQQLFVRHFVDHSSSDSSSEASSDFHSDALSDSSSLVLPSTSAGPYCKRRRFPLMEPVPALPPVAGALSPVRADLIPAPKRIRSPESATNLEGCSEDSFEPYVPREVDDDVERSDGMDIDPVEAVIEACFDFADIIRASRVDVRVEAGTEGAAGSTYEILGDLVQRFHDHTEAIPAHRIHVIEGVQREQVIKRTAELENG
ncbi:hypothetical protein Tco_1517430 [Tanacetum coccineum]